MVDWKAEWSKCSRLKEKYRNIHILFVWSVDNSSSHSHFFKVDSFKECWPFSHLLLFFIYCLFCFTYIKPHSFLKLKLKKKIKKKKIKKLKN